MRVFLAIMSLLLLVNHALADNKDYNFTGSRFLGSCSQLINPNGSTSQDMKNTITDSMDVGECIGAIKTFLVLSYELGFCRPETVTVGQMARVFVKYLEENPDKLHQGFALLAHEAFLKTWPCKSR